MPDGPEGLEDRIDALCGACEEAKGTLDHQLNWIQQIDSKAVRLLRANLLLIGLLLTVLSISVQTDTIDLSEFINLYTIFGMVALVAGAIGAAVTYIASSFEAGVGHKDLRSALKSRYTEEQLYEELADGYAEWIQFNQYVLRYNATLITVTIVLVIDAIVLLTSGALVGMYGVSFTTMSTVGFVVLLLVLLVLDILVYKSEDLVVWYFDTR